MILVIDIGNTNIKIGVFEGDKLLDSLRLATSVNKTSDEYGLAIKNQLHDRGIAIDKIEGVIMSSVNPNLNYTFEHLINYYFKIQPLVVGSKIKSGISIKYDNPKEVGADRVVNSVATYYSYGGPVIVVDCGTATTFNAINEKGEFLGGAISFGLKAASDALSHSAAKLPRIELIKPERVIGKTTISNMQSGIINGFIGMVEYIIKKMKEETPGFANAKVIATGGLSEIVAKESTTIDVIDRTLTLRGLNIIYNLNKSAKAEKGN